MSREEWFDLPWYEVEVYLEWLRDSGILKGGGGEKRQADPVAPPKAADNGKALDLASADLDSLAAQTGVQVRRAG